MTCLSHICSKLAARLTVCALAFLPVAGSSFAGIVSGQVHLVDSGNSAIRKKNDFSGVVVWLLPAEHSRDRSNKHVKMLQNGKRFEPHVLSIQTGTTVDFPNLDPIFHNAFSNFNGTIFDVSLYPPGTSRAVRFDRPGIVRVFCNIHPSMSAIIAVLDSPYFAVTDRNGVYRIAGVPPGRYQLHFFNERSTPESLERLTRTVEPTAEQWSLGDDTISEAGYLPVAHKNKYGKEYPPNSDDSTGYSLPLQ